MGAIIRATESQVDCPVSICPPFQTRNWKIASDRWSSSSALFAVDPSRSRIIGLFPAKADAPELTTSCAACPKLLKVLTRINNGAAAPSAVKTRDATKYSLTTHKSNYQQIFFFFFSSVQKGTHTHFHIRKNTHIYIYTQRHIHTAPNASRYPWHYPFSFFSYIFTSMQTCPFSLSMYTSFLFFYSTFEYTSIF